MSVLAEGQAGVVDVHVCVCTCVRSVLLDCGPRFRLHTSPSTQGRAEVAQICLFLRLPGLATCGRLRDRRGLVVLGVGGVCGRQNWWVIGRVARSGREAGVGY